MDSVVQFAFISNEESGGTGARRHVDWLKDWRRMGSFKHLDIILTEPCYELSSADVGGKGYAFYYISGPVSELLERCRCFLLSRDRILERHISIDERFGRPYATLTTAKMKEDIANVAEERGIIEGVGGHASDPEACENALEKAILNNRNLVWLKTPGVQRNTGNVIPSSCEFGSSPERNDAMLRMNLDIRTTPEADRDDALVEEIKELFGPNITFKEFDRGHAYHSPENPLVDLLERSCGHSIKRSIAKGGSDAGYYYGLFKALDSVTNLDLIGAFGPGKNDVEHKDNEHINIDVLTRFPEILKRFLESYGK